MKKRIKFLKTALLGEQVGAVASSSRYVIKNIINDLKDTKLRSIVEYGPGDGVLTRELLKKLEPDGKYLAVEIDKNFIKTLREIGDPRLTVVDAKIQDVCQNLGKYNFSSPDLVLSSIPFSLITKAERDLVTKETAKALSQDGKFIIFHQYSPMMRAPLKRYFSNVKSVFEPRNVFPCFIFYAVK